MSSEQFGSEGDFSKRVRAGKRTYFFDVKSTKSGEKFITITESIKKQDGDQAYYQKHKIFLYKEDFQKFSDALNDTLDFVEGENSSNSTERDELSWE
jgi:hypothetical protein